MERRRLGAQSDPKAARAGKESHAWRSGAGAVTRPEAPTGRGPGATLSPGPRCGERSAAFLRVAPVAAPRLGPDPGWPSGACRRLWPGRRRPLLPGPASAGRALTVTAAGPPCRGQALYGITALPSQTNLASRPYARRWPPSRGLGLPAPIAAAGPSGAAGRPNPGAWARRPVGPRHLPRWSLNVPAGQRPLHGGRTCRNLGARAAPSAPPHPAARAQSWSPRDRPNPPPPRWRLAGLRGVDGQLRPSPRRRWERAEEAGGVWGSAEEMSEAAELRVCAL